jgi:TrmH family RNA methyltransferase
MEPITSVKNETIALFHSLLEKKGRRVHGLYLAEGTRLVGECVARIPQRISMLLYTQELEEHSVVKAARLAGVPLRCCAEHCMKKATDSQNSQGIACAIRLPEPPTNAPDGNLLALDGISDPGNLGTILRTAWAFGVSRVYLGEGCADVYAPKVVRAGMGAHFVLQLVPCDSLGPLLEEIKPQGYQVIGAHLKGKSGSLTLGGRRCVVMGSEARGMSEKTAAACTHLYRIPMEGEAESLNAAVAAGIMMDRIFHT